MQAFITGSQAYGIPHKNSDVDLVIYCDIDTAEILMENKDASHSQDNPVVRYGNLNLIICTNKAEYSAWLSGTLQLCNRRPSANSMIEAKKVFDSLREPLGLNDQALSGPKAS